MVRFEYAGLLSMRGSGVSAGVGVTSHILLGVHVEVLDPTCSCAFMWTTRGIGGNRHCNCVMEGRDSQVKSNASMREECMQALRRFVSPPRSRSCPPRACNLRARGIERMITPETQGVSL